MRVLIADDEPPARRRLRALLEEADDVAIAGECGDGATAVDMIRSLRPDLVFLDVRMPELDGMAVVEAVGPERMPVVIFVTAYDEYAVRAFELAAVDYLLKPFDQDRFRQALERGRRSVQRPDALARRLADLLNERGRDDAATTHLPVRTGDRIRLLPVRDVDYITAAGSYVRLHAGASTHLLRASIGSLEERLDPRLFVRLHRGLVVNTERVRELEPLYRGEYVVWLHDGTRLVTGRTYRDRVRQVFGI